MTEQPISKTKLLKQLREAKIDISTCTDDHRMMYGLGRNILADILIAGICMGDFDEDVKQ